MANLKGTKTHTNLKEAFAGESQANRRYLYFAKNADVEGYADVAGLFRDTAEGETGHAHGHLDYLKPIGDPVTDKPIGSTAKNLASAVFGETYEYTDMYPGQGREVPRGPLPESAGHAGLTGRPALFPAPSSLSVQRGLSRQAGPDRCRGRQAPVPLHRSNPGDDSAHLFPTHGRPDL